MTRSHFRMHIFFLFVCACFVSACTSGFVDPTRTPMPIDPLPVTAASTATSTLVPTFTPRPTATEVPPTSTAAPMGMSVTTTDHEVNVVTMRILPSVIYDYFNEWVPKDGYMFVELGIKVVNLTPDTTASVEIGRINVIEEDGKTLYPSWGFAKAVANGVEISPKSLTLESWESLSLETVDFDETAFIRAIYIVKKHDPTILLFRFGESPLIEVVASQ